MRETTHNPTNMPSDPYLVMKFVEGETLEDRLKRSAVPLADIQRIMTTVAGALTYAIGLLLGGALL